MAPLPFLQCSVTHRDPAPCSWHVMIVISNWMTPLIKNRATTAQNLYEWLWLQFVYIPRFACLLSQKPKLSMRILYCGSDVDISDAVSALYVYIHRDGFQSGRWRICRAAGCALWNWYSLTWSHSPLSRKQTPSKYPVPLHKHRVFRGSRMAPWVFNHLTPNDHYSGHTAPLTFKRCILYIYSSKIGT